MRYQSDFVFIRREPGVEASQSNDPNAFLVFILETHGVIASQTNGPKGFFLYPWGRGCVIQITDMQILYSDHGLLPKHTGQLLQNVSGLVRTRYNGHRSVMKTKRDILLSMNTDIRSVVRQYFSFETMLIRP